MTFSNTPNLVVVREANPKDGTSLYEFWELKSWSWEDGEDSFENPTVSLYIAPFNGTHDTARDGLPIPDERATGSCSWDEVPYDVREEFEDEAHRIKSAVHGFEAFE